MTPAQPAWSPDALSALAGIITAQTRIDALLTRQEAAYARLAAPRGCS